MVSSNSLFKNSQKNMEQVKISNLKEPCKNKRGQNLSVEDKQPQPFLGIDKQPQNL